MVNKKVLLKSFKKIPGLKKQESSRYGKIFSEQTGIINGVIERRDLINYGYSMFQSLTAKTTVLFGHSREVSSGGLGINRDPRKAFHACIGESLERYCMSYYQNENLILKSYSSLPKNMRQKDFSLYTDNQYKLQKHFANPQKEKIYWETIESLFNSNKRTYWPASLVYLPFEAGKMSAETTSTGVSAHKNKAACILGGTLELIERDALAINFLNKLNPPEIKIETITGKNRILIAKLQTTKFNIKIYKLYTDFEIPIFLGFIWKERKNKLHYGIGACATLNTDDGIEKTLKECLFTYHYSKDVLDLKPKDKNKIKTLYEHFLYYQDHKFFKLLTKGPKIAYKKEKYSKKYLYKMIKDMGYGVWFKDLTTSDILVTGIKVFRVIIPGLVDLNKTHTLPRNNARRLWSVPKKLKLKTGKFNHLPHPFP